MRTKHVLMTTALLSLFAACTNDDFVSYEQGGQSGDAAKRPTVDVTLNVLEGNGADTRLSFIPGVGEGYQWQANDTIGALLMDKVIAVKGNEAFRPHDDIEEWEEMAWTSRYELVDYINTNYPFVRQSDGSWVTNAKMLEGNYFFTFPFAAYSGNREAIHSIGEQVQDGTSTASLQEAYAKNQFFIGYARIHAGTEGGDVMSADLEMTPVLGAVAVRIKNVGNQDFTVKKIVLQSKAFNTLIKVDPTQAKYTGEDGKNTTYPCYNINRTEAEPDWTSGGWYFNYANYEEDYNADFEERYASDKLVNNTQKSVNYNRKNALRAVINGIEKNENTSNGGSLINGADDRAELTVLNAPVQKGNNPGVMENFIIMTNIYDYEDTGKEIDAYIYTDRGMVGPVQISNINGEVNNNNGVTVISENPIVKIAPDEENLVTLEIDDNSIQADVEMSVYNESDLLQLIEWNNASTIRRVYKAALQNDVTLTKEMSDLLTKSGVNSKLYINTNGNKLVIAKDAAANILDYVLVSGSAIAAPAQSAATIVVENNLTLGSKSFVNGSYSVGNIYTSRIELKNELEVAEGASLTVASPITYETTGDYQKQELIIAENEGTVTINANAEVEHLQIAENKADVTINANVTFIGTDANSNKNLENATITIGKGAIVSAGTPTQSYLTNEGKNDYPGEDEYADWAVIYNNGQINNLVNAQYGKVIAGQGSTTNANSNAGEIDKSADIKAVVAVNDANKGVISYTVKSKMALKDIIDSKITKLVIDGGSVEGTAWYNSVPATSYTASDVKWIEIKGQGGSLGTEIVNGATPSHCTSIFDNVVEITTSANATLADINFSGASIDFNIEAATTNIRGTVKAEGADVVIGSYDGRNYKGIDATLNIPATDGELFVKSINKTSDHANEVTAKVINQGNISLPYNVEPGTGIVWEGAGKVNGEDPNAGQKPEAGTNGEYTLDLNSLANDLQKLDFSNVKKIVVNSAIAPTAEQYANLKELFKDREVVVGSNVTVNLGAGDGSMVINKLTISGNATIGDTRANSNKVMLTVNSLEVSAGSTLTVNESFILVSGNVRPNTSGNVTALGTITNNSSYPGGAVVAVDNSNPQGAYLKWNDTSKRFEAE